MNAQPRSPIGEELAPAHTAQVFGMRRSGNHAIINWMMRNAPDGATGGLFYNNCRTGSDPTQKFASLDVYGSDWQVIPAGKTALDKRRRKAGSRPMVVISYEDAMPRAGGKPQKASRGFTDADFDSTILIYRSFLNWSASLLAKLQKNAGYGPVERMRIMFRAMKIYADGLDRLAEPHIVGICYDAWAASENTRLALLDRLRLTPRDNSLGAVQRFGGGSSFEGRAEAAEKLSTLSRADQMVDNPEYQVMLWSVAHDVDFVERLMAHFPQDAERLVGMAETAEIGISLPLAEGAA